MEVKDIALLFAVIALFPLFLVLAWAAGGEDR